jgi:predicted phosphodiesterase
VRVAVLSDIHGNAVGLHAVLRDLERVDHDSAVCLGDVPEGGPQPAESVDLVRELGCPVIEGNCDHWLVHYEFEAGMPERSAMGAWAREQLGEQRLSVVGGYAPGVELDLGPLGRLVCAHGAPGSRVERILPGISEPELAAFVGDASVLAVGHTHVQWSRRLGESLFFNPGRIGGPMSRLLTGEPHDLDGTAEYAILTAGDDGLAVELRRVRYSLDDLREACSRVACPTRTSSPGAWRSRARRA